MAEGQWGDPTELDPGIEDFIRDNYVSLRNMLDVKDVIPYLIQHRVLTRTDKQTILSKDTKEDKAEELIDTLSGSGKCTTKQFINILRLTNQTGLINCMSEANFQSVVDGLNNKYGDPVLPVRLQLAVVSQGQAGNTSKEPKDKILERILELERELFTVDVFNDPVRYRKVRKLFKKHKALLKRALKGSVILLLTFLRQTDVDRFYHNHYRVGEGSLSQQLSHILISEHLQDKVKGAQLIVRLQVKHEDYLRVRGRLGRGLVRTTSVDNLLALPHPNRHVEHSSLRSLDLAVIGREDRSCADGADDVSTLTFYNTARQVQAVVRTVRKKSEGQARQLQELDGRETLSRKDDTETLQEGPKPDIHKYFYYIKEKVSSGWKDLAFHLGFEQPDIHNIEDRNLDNKSGCMDLLEEWLKRNRERATIEVLMEALSEAGLQHIVDGLKSKYPDELADKTLPKYPASVEPEASGSHDVAALVHHSD